MTSYRNLGIFSCYRDLGVYLGFASASYRDLSALHTTKLYVYQFQGQMGKELLTDIYTWNSFKNITELNKQISYQGNYRALEQFKASVNSQNITNNK